VTNQTRLESNQRLAEIRERLTPYNPENDMVLYASMGDDIRWLISRVTELQTEVQHSQERIKELEAVRLAADKLASKCNVITSKYRHNSTTSTSSFDLLYDAQLAVEAALESAKGET
jgi:hypothetical protein